jgi:hypothetical protein
LCALTGEDLDFSLIFEDISKHLQTNETNSNLKGLGRVPEGIVVFVTEVRNGVAVKVFVQDFSHHVQSIFELLGVPWIEVSIFVVVHFYYNFCFGISNVFRSGCNLSVHSCIKFDVSLKLGGDLVGFIDLWE